MIKTFRDEYSFLSNMYIQDFPWQGLVYPSLENAYQAMKCISESEKVQFTRITPGEAKKLGNRIMMRPDFDSFKYELMRNMLDVKFQGELLKKLLNTAPESIVEGNWWHDNYWGACQCSKCKDKVHQNKLGELLQRKRNLSAEYSDMFTMYEGSIYNRANQAIVERPTVLYDKDTYTIIKIGDYDMCMNYLSTAVHVSPELGKTMILYEIIIDDFMSKNIECEKMNQILSCTGSIKHVLNLE